nr:hypothetical protein [Tanacetum cinerariifolium]
MAAIEVPQTLEYRSGQLNSAPALEVEIFTNWKKRFMYHIIGIEPQCENILKNGPFIPMIVGQRKSKGQWTADERKAANLDQVMDLKLCYNAFKFKEDSELASLSGKLKYEENLINNIYETKKNKSLVPATPLSTAFFSTSIVQDFQDSPADEEDTRSSHEYLNDLEEEYQARALLAKSKRFFKKGTQSPSQHKPELRPTKDFEAKYSKVKAKLALLSSSSSAFKASMVKNKGLIAESYEWDEEEVSSDDNEMVEVKVLMVLAEENDDVSKEGARNGEWVKFSMRKRILGVDQLTKDPSGSGLKYLVFVKSSADDKKVTIPSVERPWLFEAKGFILPNHDTDESLFYSIPLPPLKELDGAEPISGPRTIKSIFRSKYTFKAKSLKDVTINEPSSAPAKGNKSSSASKVHSAPAGRMSSRPNIPRPSKRFFRPCIHCGSIDHLSNDCLYYPICKLCGSYDHETNGHNRIISLERKINPRNPQHAFKKYKACGSPDHTTPNHYDIEWFKRGEAFQAKKVKALKSTRAESSNANRSKTPTK